MYLFDRLSAVGFFLFFLRKEADYQLAISHSLAKVGDKDVYCVGLYNVISNLCVPSPHLRRFCLF